MLSARNTRWFAVAVWALVTGFMALPVVLALQSPYVEGRDNVYIFGAMGGVIALALFFVQPLLAGFYLPASRVLLMKRAHKAIGIGISVLIVAHIVGLYLTSPMDMTDALLLASPTAFSVYGSIGLWTLTATILLVLIRKRWRWSLNAWRVVHNLLAAVVVVSSVTHALLIDGLMHKHSKIVLCLGVLLVTLGTTIHLRVLKKRRNTSCE